MLLVAVRHQISPYTRHWQATTCSIDLAIATLSWYSRHLSRFLRRASSPRLVMARNSGTGGGRNNMLAACWQLLLVVLILLLLVVIGPVVVVTAAFSLLLLEQVSNTTGSNIHRHYPALLRTYNSSFPGIIGLKVFKTGCISHNKCKPRTA